MSEAQREVYRQFQESQNKYAYFLLAAAGAAIALVLRQTEGSRLAWSQLPLAASVFCWGMSFFCGCRYMGYITSSLYSNLDLLTVEAGIHPKTGTDATKISIASKSIREEIGRNSNLAVRSGVWQFRLLVGGAIFYVGWHIWEMWIRTI